MIGKSKEVQTARFEETDTMPLVTMSKKIIEIYRRFQRNSQSKNCNSALEVKIMKDLYDSPVNRIWL